MKNNILVLFVYIVSNVDCLYNIRQEYTRIKRAKYNYPSKFFKLPPSSSQITGPFSYTPPPGYRGDNGPPPGYRGDNGPPPGYRGDNGPPPGYMGDNGPPLGYRDDNGPPPGYLGNSGPPPANLRAYKVSKKPSDGLGDEDIHNLFKYLSKQDLNKIVELAVKKDKFSEHRNPYIDTNNYEYESSAYENQEQRQFSKDLDEDLDTKLSHNLKDENIEYSNPNFKSYQDRLQRITRNHNIPVNDDSDYSERVIKNVNVPLSENSNYPPVNTKNHNYPKNNFDYMQQMTKNYNNPQDDYDYLQGKLADDNPEKENYVYSPGTTKNHNSLLNKDFDYPEEITVSYNTPKISNFNYQQNGIKNPLSQNINYSQRVTKNYDNIYHEDFKYPKHIFSSDDRPKNNNYVNSQETSHNNDLQNYNNFNINLPLNGDLTSPDQLLFLDNYIQKEMSKQTSEENIYSVQPNSQDQSSPKPLYIKEQDYQISYTNNVPQVVDAVNNAYKAENFADLPLMNYDSKLDTVNSYNVPHYTVTQVKSRQKVVQSPETNQPIVDRAPSRSAGLDQSDAHLKAIKIWTHRSKGMAYTLHDDGTLSPERPIRPKI